MEDPHNNHNDSIYDEELPLIPKDTGCSGDESFMYDEEGTFIGAAFPGATLTGKQPAPEIFQPFKPLPLKRACSLKTLDGSWYIQITPKTSYYISVPTRGAMRIEVGEEKLRVSGDIYVKPWKFQLPERSFSPMKPITANPLIIRRNWYPHFPNSEYRWYFKSAGAYYTGGKLLFKFERHLWDISTQEFVNSDRGWMEFECQTNILTFPGLPQATIKINGEAMIGGTKYNVTATKTSPYYRGCEVEVDVMQERSWPATATDCSSGTVSFTGAFRSSGLDFRAVVNELDVPEDPSLSISELHTLMGTHRTPPSGSDWKLWLLVGSSMGGTYGIMFDDIAPYREGAVGFYDPTLPDYSYIQAAVRNKKLGEVPLAFLRTLIHEAGHAFNLYHPKHDVHGPDTGTTLMNQTGDVMGFASTADPYPCNATFGFNEHNRDSLIHSPDPQVKPGWKRFGWGHGSHWSGVSYPVDAMGLGGDEPEADDLELHLELPKEAFVGEMVIAKVSLVNIGEEPHRVTTALNLAEGDLKMTVTPPDGKAEQVRDVIVVCGDRHLIELAPKQRIESYIQLYYTSKDFTFDQPGRYAVQAHLDIGDKEGHVAKSATMHILIRTPMNDKELDLSRLTLDENFGRAIALGDVGADEVTQEKLSSIADVFADTDTGAAAAIVLANSLSREVRDIRGGDIARKAAKKDSEKALDQVMKGRDAGNVMRLATAVVSPAEKNAPVLDSISNRIKDASKNKYTKKDSDQANKMLDDFRAGDRKQK